jgi:hypothetical protein
LSFFAVTEVLFRGGRTGAYKTLLNKTLEAKKLHGLGLLLLFVLLSTLAALSMWYAEESSASAQLCRASASRLEAGCLESKMTTFEALACTNGAAFSSPLSQPLKMYNVTCDGSVGMDRVVFKNLKKSSLELVTGRGSITCGNVSAELAILGDSQLCLGLMGQDFNFRGCTPTGALNLENPLPIANNTTTEHYPSGDTSFILRYILLQVLGGCAPAWLTQSMAFFASGRRELHLMSHFAATLLIISGLLLAYFLPAGSEATFPSTVMERRHSLYSFATACLFNTMLGISFTWWQDFIGREQLSEQATD